MKPKPKEKSWCEICLTKLFPSTIKLYQDPTNNNQAIHAHANCLQYRVHMHEQAKAKERGSSVQVQSLPVSSPDNRRKV